MTDEEIMNIWLHMSGKAEGIVEAGGEANFPVMFARAIITFHNQCEDARTLASDPAGLRLRGSR